MTGFNGLSVVIPVGPEEHTLLKLLPCLKLLPEQSEIIFSCCDANSPWSEQMEIEQELVGYQVHWLVAATGRAKQLNAGAELSSKSHLWFLHADSQFDKRLVKLLLSQLDQQPEAFHYCLLRFDSDAPDLMALNHWGANLRSKILGVPFGDQGFCLSRMRFEQLGGYPEEVDYGEDHLLVWYARQYGMRLCCCPEPIYTSARRYQDSGWLKLTLRYQYLWLKQALPEWWRLMTGRHQFRRH